MLYVELQGDKHDLPKHINHRQLLQWKCAFATQLCGYCWQLHPWAVQWHWLGQQANWQQAHTQPSAENFLWLHVLTNNYPPLYSSSCQPQCSIQEFPSESVRSVAGRRVTKKCLDVFSWISFPGNYIFYTFSFHFNTAVCPLEGL